MRCAACQTENPDNAPACSKCGAKLATRNARRAGRGRDDTKFGSRALDKKGLGWLAYRCGVIGLIPFVGLVLGPMALVLGLIAWLRDRRGPHLLGLGPALAGMLLGGIISLANWAGLALMIYGLVSERQS
jgi:hypothetical protein